MIEEHEELITNAFRQFNKLERVLRFKIGETLSKFLGIGWLNQLPQSIMDRLLKKRQSTEKELGARRSDDLLEYADFSELVEIIRYFWNDLYSSFFSDKEFTFTLFDEIRNYRNALMHSVILADDCPTFIRLCEDFTERIQAIRIDTGFSKVPEKTFFKSDKNIAIPSKQESQTIDDSFHQQITNSLIGMSGYFDGEFDAIVDYVNAHLRLCTMPLLEQIRHKFKDLPGTDEKINAIIRKLPPERPNEPDLTWKQNASKWLKWAVTQYLPYRSWMMLQNQVDAEIEKMGLLFEDWLYNAYPDLIIKHPDSFVFSSYRHVQKHLNKNKKVLWVLLDNFPFYYQRNLASKLSECGFSFDIIRQLSMLPSFTGVSRVSALSGRLSNQVEKRLSENKTVLDSWKLYSDKKVLILENLDSLDTIRAGDSDLFIYIFSRLDQLWHTKDSKDFDRESEIDAALDRLVSKVSKSVTRISQSDPIVLIVSSDHGGIYLHPDSEKLTVPPSAVKENDYEEHRRFVRTSKNDALSNNEWFFLDKDNYYLHDNYAIARGWRYIGDHPRSFTHGGLSPEETVVPMFICERTGDNTERLQPFFEHATSPVRMGRASEIKILIRNPYFEPMEDVEITLIDFGLSFPKVDVDAQLEAKTEAIAIALPAKMKIERNSTYINIRANFTLGDQPRSVTTTLRINVRTIYKNQMDDDFGEMFK